MPEAPSREPEDRRPQGKASPPGMMTSDVPTDLRAERFVTLTVGGNIDDREAHPTDANPEARG